MYSGMMADCQEESARSVRSNLMIVGQVDLLSQWRVIVVGGLINVCASRKPNSTHDRKRVQNPTKDSTCNGKYEDIISKTAKAVASEILCQPDAKDTEEKRAGDRRP